MKQAQTSVEFLVILSVTLVILISVILLSQQQISTVVLTKSISDAKNSVDDLAGAARDVYAQGTGAKKQVFVKIPSAYNSSDSSVGNKSIKMRVGGTDYISTLSFDVHGSLPTASGGQWVWVISEGNRVRIGAAMLEVSKSAISVMMNKNSSVSDSFYVKNIWTGPINVTITKIWTHENVSMTVLPATYPLAINEQQLDVAYFTTANNAVGFYTGTIKIEGTDGTTNETVLLPVTVEVETSGSQAPPLTIVPSIWNETVLPPSNVTKEFTVCTNDATSLTGVTFATTAGAPGIWVGSTNPLGAIGPSTCLPKIFTLSVPNGTLPGVYTGTITGTGVGVSGAEDTVALFITVGGNLSDITGPRVLNIVNIPARPFVGDPVTISALCDDSTTGNSTIKKGEIKIDGGSWTTMLPADGTYNSPMENVTYTVYSLTAGQHNASLRCTDYFNNVGTSVNYNFNVMKEILFVTKDLGASGSEQNWINWLNTHSSEEGFAWTKDQQHRNVVIDSGFDVNAYAIVVLAEDGVTGGSTGSQLVTKLVNYIGSGGIVLFLDEAIDDTLEDFGFATDSGTHTLTYTSIRDNTHYITTGLVYPSNYTIYTSATKLYHAKGLSGTILTTDYSYGEHLTHPHIGYGSGFVIWGATMPYRFNTNGNGLTVRVFDYTIMTSTVGMS